MYKYAIWQMKNTPELLDYRFMAWKDSNPRPTAPVAHAANYNKVYEGEVENTWGGVQDVLENLFYVFNMERPDDFRGHSLSVSDVVELDGRFFYCNTLGWRHVEDFQNGGEQ